MRQLSLSLLLILAVACGSTSDATDPMGEATSSSNTKDFSVNIVQTNEPVLISQSQPVDFRYDISITNNTAAPVTVKRVTLQTTGGGPYSISSTVRQYDKVIDPGATETVEYWTSGQVSDYTMGTRLPVVLRANVTTSAAGAEDRVSSFSQRVIARYQAGIAR